MYLQHCKSLWSLIRSVPPLILSSSERYFGNLHPFVQHNALDDLCGYFGAIEASKVIKVGTEITRRSAACFETISLRYDWRSLMSLDRTTG